MPTNNTFDSSLVIDPLNRQALNTDVRSLLEINALRSASRYTVVSGGAFTDNGSSNFAGAVSNPFDDARVYANGAVTINGTPLFSGFGNGLTLGPTGVLQNVSAAIATSLKLGRVAEAVTIDVPAYWVPTIGAVERTIDVSQFPLNGAADVAGAFGAFRTVSWTGGSLNLPDATVLKNLTIVVENGDVNLNGDRHLLENVRLIVRNGAVNLGDVRSVNSSVYASGAIRMNQGARFGGKNLLETQQGDVIFNGATETIGPKDYVKVIAHGDIFLNAAANTRGDFLSSEDFFANRASTIVGKIWATQSITFNASVQVISDSLLNLDFPLANQPAIAIIDTGLARNNPDIDYGRVTPLGDRVGGDDNPLLAAGEGNQHGTHTLGIIAATQNNNLGIDGANGTAPIYVSRAVGSGQWAQSVVEFIDRYEADGKQPHPIIYLGFDLTQLNADGSITTRYELTLEERAALEYARQKGALIVVPAGNDGGVMSVLGQAAQEFDNIVTVGALDATGRAPYSSYGAGLTIMAPGGTVDQPILSTVGDGLGTMAGTSVAAAYAVGQIANVWAANPGLSYQQVIDIIKATARDIDLPGWDAETGAGILDVNAAIDLAQQTESQLYDPPATILPESWTGEGVVLPLERAANYSTDFTGRIMSSIGANVREAPTTASRIIGSRAFNSAVKFTRWTYGDRVTDIALGTPDERWYYDAEKGGWIASAIVDGNAPGSTALRPIALPKPNPTTQPVIPIDTNSAFYQNGRNNPFAYNWIGQCTWYAYGRMLETGLLPAGVKANGLFLGNAEAWRRDAARAGLAVNASPTPGTRGLVVWPPGVQGGNRQYGHVAFLEEVLADGRIRISESNWAGKKVGDRILTPAQYAGLAFIPLENARVNPQFPSPQAKPGQQREYRVRSGDTLSGIALRELGNADRWREIKKADGGTFTDTEARLLQTGGSIYLPINYISLPAKTSGTNNTSGKPSSTPILGSSFQTIAPGKIASTVNFGLQNQNIWGGGQGFSFGGKISNSAKNTLNLGPVNLNLKASYDFEAFVSGGTFDLDIPVLFDVSWNQNANGNYVAVDLSSNLKSDILLGTLLGASFKAEAKISADITGEIPIPFGTISISRELFKLEGGFDSTKLLSELISSKLLLPKDTFIIDLGLASSSSGTENPLTSEDTASQEIDILGALSLIPQIKLAVQTAQSLGLKSSLKANIKQETFLNVSGFEIDYDNQKNGNEIIIEIGKSGIINIPIINPSQGVDFMLTAKPIASLFTQFSLSGGLDASFDPNKIDAVNKTGTQSPKFSIALETPYIQAFKAPIFNPFEFTRPIQISPISIKLA